MSKTLLVALREFRQRVRSRGFWLGVLGLPMTFLIIWGVSSFAGGDRPAVPAFTPPLATAPARRSTSTAASAPTRSLTLLPTSATAPSLTPVPTATRYEAAMVTLGYVDQADLIKSIPTNARRVAATRLLSFPDVAAAQQALATGAILAYYIVPADYRTTGFVTYVSDALPTTPPDTTQLDGLLLANLLPGASGSELTRLHRPFNGPAPLFIDTNATHQTETGDGGLNFLPFLITMLIMTPLFTSGGYLLQSLLQEKSSRVMEVLLLSLRPTQLLTGKLLGLSLLTAVQYLIWALLAWVTLLARGGPTPTFVADLHLSLIELLLIALYALGGYLLYATVMAGIGALAPNLENSRTWVFIVSLPIVIPFYLWTAIVAAPDAPFATVLSLIPFSAPVAMLLRMNVTAIPVWQHGLSLTLLALTGMGAIWLMARFFRAQTLLSGEALSLRRIWRALTVA